MIFELWANTERTEWTFLESRGSESARLKRLQRPAQPLPVDSHIGQEVGGGLGLLLIKSLDGPEPRFGNRLVIRGGEQALEG